MKVESIVCYKDDEQRKPFIVHAVLEHNQVVLGLGEYPDIEQDFSTPIDILEEFEGDELIKKQQEIEQLINT